MKKIVCAFNVFIISVLLMMVSGCGEEIEIEKINATVAKIENGNTIRLSNDLTVILIGIRNDNSAREYLESELIGKPVSLITNLDDEKFISEYETEVYAYVNYAGRGINGEMLKKGFARLSTTFLIDSLSAFKTYAERKECSPLSDEEIVVKCAPATFTICYGDINNVVGTGFFISPEGLAVTNKHVYDLIPEDKFVIYPWNTKAEISSGNSRRFKQLVSTSWNDEEDWTIFYVSKKNSSEKFQYLNICNKEVKKMNKVYVLGNPDGRVGTITTGEVNNIISGIYSVSADMNHGNSGGPVVNYCGEVIGIATAMEILQKTDIWASIVSGDEVVVTTGKINYAFSILPVKSELDNRTIYYGGK